MRLLALPKLLAQRCSPGCLLLHCTASDIARQIDSRQAEAPKSTASAAWVLGLAACRLWWLSWTGGRLGIRSYADLRFGSKSACPRCDASSRAGPQACCPSVSRAGKVRSRRTRWHERSRGAVRGDRRRSPRSRECTCGLRCWVDPGVSEMLQSEPVCSQCLLLSVVAWHTFLARCTGHSGVSHECFGVGG